MIINRNPTARKASDIDTRIAKQTAVVERAVNILDSLTHIREYIDYHDHDREPCLVGLSLNANLCIPTAYMIDHIVDGSIYYTAGQWEINPSRAGKLFASMQSDSAYRIVLTD